MINPSLKEHGLDYETIWIDSGVIYKADLTFEELMSVRNTLIEQIKENIHIKYLVVDWMSTIKIIFDLNITDDLNDITYLTHMISVNIGGYSHNILIYEVY